MGYIRCKMLVTIIPLVWNIFNIDIFSKLDEINLKSNKASWVAISQHIGNFFSFNETLNCLFAILCTMLLMTIFRDSIRVFLFFLACYILINSTITYENKGRIRMRDILDYKFISGFVITMYRIGRFSAMI